MLKIKSILAFDLDGTLVPRNQFEIHPNGLAELLEKLNSLGHLTIPVTGKPAKYASNIFSVNKLQNNGLIAENAGVYTMPNSDEVKIFGSSIDEMYQLRNLAGLTMKDANIQKITIDDKKYEVVIDPDDHSIFTVFTDPSFVTHRWTYKHEIEADFLVKKLREIVKNNNLDNYLAVLDPFPDGGVQVIRKDVKTGLPIDKSYLPQAIEKMYPDSGKLPIAMFGDGHNDIPAMTPERVMPITFNNSHKDVINFVKSKNGYVSNYDTPEGLGVVDGLLWLTKNDFFGQDSQTVEDLIKTSFLNLD